MAYIYIDESGDLGFNWSKKKTSKYLIITALFTTNKTPLERIVKRVFSSFTKKEMKWHGGTLHCYKEQPKTRIKLLNLLVKKEVSIIAIYLNKKKVYTNLKNERHVLYNFVTNILLDRIYKHKLIPTTGKINLIASRRETNKFLNQNFKQYLVKQVEANHKSQLDIEIKSPHEEKCLQVVDFACWAIFRKYEHGDSSYYEIIKSKVVQENPLYP